MHVLCGGLLEIILVKCNSSQNITMIVITMIAIVVRIFKSHQWNSIYGRSSSNEVHRFYYSTRCRDSSPKMTPSLELPHWWCENNLNQLLNILFWLLKIDTARFFIYTCGISLYAYYADVTYYLSYFAATTVHKVWHLWEQVDSDKEEWKQTSRRKRSIPGHPKLISMVKLNLSLLSLFYSENFLPCRQLVYKKQCYRCIDLVNVNKVNGPFSFAHFPSSIPGAVYFRRTPPLVFALDEKCRTPVSEVALMKKYIISGTVTFRPILWAPSPSPSPSPLLQLLSLLLLLLLTLLLFLLLLYFYPRPVLAFGYCHCLRLYVCVCVCVSVCPREYSGLAQAGIARFGPKMQKALVKVSVVFG